MLNLRIYTMILLKATAVEILVNVEFFAQVAFGEFILCDALLQEHSCLELILESRLSRVPSSSQLKRE
jgi:hypothetical protein